MNHPCSIRKLFVIRDFNLDLLWNYASMAILMIGGFMINVIISVHYDIETLGAFTQVLALLFITSQGSVLGLQFSALKHVSELTQEPATLHKVLWTSLGLAAVLGLIASSVLYLAAGLITVLVNSALVGIMLSHAAWSLFFLSLNKVLLRTLNGLSWMRRFALCQALRPVFMLAFILAAVPLRLPATWLGWVFVFSELFLFLVMLGFVATAIRPRRDSWDLAWAKRHLSFGGRFFMGGLITETNTRVDILMLGLLSSDQTVGYYSFAAIISEGFYQLLAVVRNKVSPMLTPLLKERRYQDLELLIRQLRKYIYPISAALALIIIGGFKPLVWIIFRDHAFHQSWIVLCILLSSLVICAGHIPFTFTLLLAGRPGKNTLVFLGAFIPNILLNLFLIPLLGIYGAAIATALANLIFLLSLRRSVRRELNFHL